MPERWYVGETGPEYTEEYLRQQVLQQLNTRRNAAFNPLVWLLGAVSWLPILAVVYAMAWWLS